MAVVVNFEAERKKADADALDHLWKSGVQKDTQPAALSRQAHQLTGDCMVALLERLYPGVEADSWRA